ncbi:carbon-nitrogen hydrolase family protein, partial [Butyricicoccus sp. 1XD8-22]
MQTRNLVTVASIQMNCKLGDKEYNLSQAYALIKKAVEKGANLIVLPELFNTGYRVEESDVELAETIPGETSDWMIKISQEFKLTIVSCILEKDSVKGLIYDTA